MKLYAKVSRSGEPGSYCNPIKDFGLLTDEMAEASVGDKWTIELVSMTDAEYEALPEFEGW